MEEENELWDIIVEKVKNVFIEKFGFDVKFDIECVCCVG